MAEKKIGDYSYVTPETKAEKAMEAKKAPKDRMLHVERKQSYEVTLQDMFAMREHFRQEGITALKNVVLAFRDYKSAVTQRKTWEDQIAKAMEDIPELRKGNELTAEELITKEDINRFDEVRTEVEKYHNDIALVDVVPENQNLEDKK